MLKKNYASLNSSRSSLYELSNSDIKKLHEVILSIYDDLFDYCEKYSLKLIAGGGTALGAVRHNGFIPWDDDMDLNLVRDDYEEFIKHFDKELGSKYDLLAPGYKNGSACFLMRVYKKNTLLMNMVDETAPYPAGIYIDITPIDFTSNNKMMQRLKGLMADALRFISYSVYWKQYRSKSLEEFMLHSEGKNYYRLRIAVGTLFSLLKAEKWFKIFDDFIKGKESNFVTVAAGRKKYCGEIYPVSVFFPLAQATFENRHIYLYNNIHIYLKKMYGDYMKIPDINDREKHLCLKLDFNKGKVIDK